MHGYVPCIAISSMFNLKRLSSETTLKQRVKADISYFRHLPDSGSGGGRSGSGGWCRDLLLEKKGRKSAIFQEHLILKCQEFR